MTRTASRPASPRVRPERLAQQRLAQQRGRQQRMRQAAGIGLPPLLEDKLRVPRPTLEILRRQRVTGLIDAAVLRRVTVLSGPAGAGKTVACAAWAAARPAARQPAWLTVDAGDREPARFWQYVLAALVRVRAVGPEDAGQLAAAPPEAYPLRIAAVTRGRAEPAILVIDDVHALGGSGALTGLDLLIRHAPPALRLVLCGRCVPGVALSRLRVAGEVTDIGAADLACTPQEAEAYVDMLGIGMTEAQRAGLLRRTEGWMAGLRLAVMPAPGMPETAALSPGRGGRAIIDYVRDEVLGPQPPQVRAFLLRTSVAPSLSGGLADALTGGSGTGARTLERLARENSLVGPAGRDGEYRYHPMLREVLTDELNRELPGEVPALLRRAARWHAAQGQALQAVRTAAQAGDWDFGVHVLAQAGAGVLAPDGPAELESALSAFPPDHRAGTAPVAAALAAARLWQGDADGAGPHLDCAQRSLPALDGDELAVVEPWLAALRVMRGACDPGAGAGWLARHRALAEQAAATAATVPQYRAAGLLWFALGCALLRRWDPAAARLALGHATAQLAAGSLPGLRARALAWQALAAAQCGELAAADVMLAEAAGGPEARHPAVACPLALAGAQASLARDELDAARHGLDEAGRCAGGQGAGEPAAAVVGGVLRAHCAVAESDLAGAEAIIARLRAGSAGDQPLDWTLAALGAGAALAAGERDRAAAVLEGHHPAGPEAALAAGQPGASLAGAAEARRTARAGAGDPEPCPREPGAPEAAALAVRLARARLALAAGDEKGALAEVAACLAGPPAGLTLRDRIGALLTAAVAQRRLGQVAEAAQAVEQALVLAEPEGAFRVFLDGGLAVRSAMTVLVPPTSRCAGFAGRVLERFDGQPPRRQARPAAAGTAGAAGPAGLPLTGSELAVLRFLPSHMTNQEIAEALFLSINTVKTHLRSAYRKLGVANRRQAIARGRRLDLL
jgi:LuxR family transcriptional regulator, maltose regulon positive regulatory protein